MASYIFPFYKGISDHDSVQEHNAFHFIDDLTVAVVNVLLNNQILLNSFILSKN